jgi:hypothetical protein
VGGYGRVSTGQSLASQEVELLAAGCAKVFSEKVSGAKTDRVELAKVLKRRTGIAPGIMQRLELGTLLGEGMQDIE